MNCHLLLFAQLADAIGQNELTLELPAGSTVADALDELCREHLKTASLQTGMAIAVDECYATRDSVLADGCTVALIPPVSGG